MECGGHRINNFINFRKGSIVLCSESPNFVILFKAVQFNSIHVNAVLKSIFNLGDQILKANMKHQRLYNTSNATDDRVSIVGIKFAVQNMNG